MPTLYRLRWPLDFYWLVYWSHACNWISLRRERVWKTGDIFLARFTLVFIHKQAAEIQVRFSMVWSANVLFMSFRGQAFYKIDLETDEILHSPSAVWSSPTNAKYSMTIQALFTMTKHGILKQPRHRGWPNENRWGICPKNNIYLCCGADQNIYIYIYIYIYHINTYVHVCAGMS